MQNKSLNLLFDIINTIYLSMSEGIVYIATGGQYVEEAKISAKSVKEAMPEIGITMITDQDVQSRLFDQVIPISDPDYSFRDQITYLPESPYERTLYLDSDIYVCEEISEIFVLLDQFDIAMAEIQVSPRRDFDTVPECFYGYNTGVVAYNNTDQFTEFCKQWESIYDKLREPGEPYNQPSMRKAIYESDLRVATLPRKYNCMFREPGHVRGAVKVFHGRLTEVDGPGAGKYHDPKKSMAEINKTTESRVFTQLGGVSTYSNKQDSLIHRARLSARQHGIKHVIKEGGKLVYEQASKIFRK